MANAYPALITRDSRTAGLSGNRRWQSEAGAWLFNIGLVLFLGSLIFLGGLFVYNRTLIQTRTEWQAQVDTQEADLRPDLLQQLIDLSNELTATKTLLEGHVFTSSVFSFLEQSTLPKVQYSNFGFSTQSLKIDVTAQAASYQTVADQIRTLEAHPQVQSVEFGGLARSEQGGNVGFRMSIVVKPSLLRLAPSQP